MRGDMTPKLTPEQLQILNLLRDSIRENAKNHGFNEPPKGVSEELWRGPEFDIIRAAIFSSKSARRSVRVLGGGPQGQARGTL